MAFVLNPWSLLGVVLLAFAWAMAGVVYFARPRAWQNRLLAVLLFLEGGGMGAGLGLMWLTDDYATSFAWQMVGFVLWAAMMPVYLLFLATLDAPMVRPLRTRPAQAVLWIATVAAPIGVLLYPQTLVPGLAPVWWAHWELVPGPHTLLFMQVISAVSFLGLLVVVSAWRRATSPLARARGKALAVAFGTRDGLWMLLWFLFPLYQLNLGQAGSLILLIGAPMTSLLFVALVGYGILKAQLFDIDLRVKWTVKQSTIAGVLVAVFFLVSEGAERVVESALGPCSGSRPRGSSCWPTARCGASDSAWRTRRSPPRPARRPTCGSANTRCTAPPWRAPSRTCLREQLGIAPERARAIEAEVRRAAAGARA